MKYGLLAVAVTSLNVFICVTAVESTQCECLCTSDINDVNLTVSGAYCKSDGTFYVDDGSDARKCSQSCHRKWRIATQNSLCLCEINTESRVCTCPGNSARNSPEVKCDCNLTNNAMETPETTTKPTIKVSPDFSNVYDQNVHVVNSTFATPQESPPRKYSPIGVGLGVTFGLAAIIAIVLVLLFFYRRHKEGTENQRKTPEVPVYDSTLEGESRQTWTSHRGSIDNPTYKKNGTDCKIPPAPSQDLSQDSSTHYTALQLNDRGVSNGGYADAENYSKAHNGHSTSWDTDEHEYQGLYTEVPSTPSPKDESIPKSDSEAGYISSSSPGDSLGESLGDSLGDSLQRVTKLSAAEDTDSSEPYYIKLNQDDISIDQSPCLELPSMGIYSGSTSGDSGDYEQLQLNREDLPPLPPSQRLDEDDENEDETGHGAYGIMVMEDRVGESADPPDEEYDHLDRGPIGSPGTRPLG